MRKWIGIVFTLYLLAGCGGSTDLKANQISNSDGFVISLGMDESHVIKELGEDNSDNPKYDWLAITYKDEAVFYIAIGDTEWKNATGFNVGDEIDKVIEKYEDHIIKENDQLVYLKFDEGEDSYVIAFNHSEGIVTHIQLIAYEEVVN